jgi:hypothetical protein
MFSSINFFENLSPALDQAIARFRTGVRVLTELELAQTLTELIGRIQHRLAHAMPTMDVTKAIVVIKLGAFNLKLL